MLTAQRETFAAALAAGDSQADAYRKAYPRSLKWKQEAVWSEASTLAKDPKVCQRVAELRARAAEANAVTLEGHVAELAELREAAKRAGQLSAAIQAEVARGKASGLYVERLQHAGPGGGPVQVARVELVPMLPAEKA